MASEIEGKKTILPLRGNQFAFSSLGRNIGFWVEDWIQ